MLRFSLISIIIISFNILNAQVIDIPDVNFKQALIDNGIDINGDGEIQVEEAEIIDSLDVSFKSIINIKGIEKFTSLKYLDFSHNDLSNSPWDYDFYAQVNLSSLKELEYLDCSWSEMRNLIIAELPKINYIDCSRNQIYQFDFSLVRNIEYLDVGHNWISSQCKFENFPNLKHLNLSSNWFYKMVVRDSPLLEYLNFSGNDSYNDELIFSNLPRLEEYHCAGNNLTLLHLRNFPSLRIVNGSKNKIDQISAIGCDSIAELYITENKLTDLDLSFFQNLEVLDGWKNQIGQLDLVLVPKLKKLLVGTNEISTLDFSNCPLLTELTVRSNQLTSLDLSENPLLKVVNCERNLISSVDLSNSTLLEVLNIFNNELSSLDVSNNINLKELNCSSNALRELNTQNLTKLSRFKCSNNSIENLNLDHNFILYEFWCDNNLLQDLNLDSQMYLSQLVSSINQIKTLDLSKTIRLRTFAHYNDTILEHLILKNGKSIYTGSKDWGNFDLHVGFRGSTNLSSICVDDKNIGEIESYLDEVDISDCLVSSFCTVHDGGILHSLNGISFFDNEEECTNKLPIKSKIKYQINFENDSGSFFGKVDGTFGINLNEGEYQIIPKLNNPQLFNIEPAFIDIDIPQDVNTADPYFCITPKIPVDQVSVSIIPVDQARPGFTSEYKLIVNNEGTTVVSGRINFQFDSEFMTFLSSSETPIEESSGNIIWQIDNLQPFNSWESHIQMQMNSPMDTPPLNGGERLKFKSVFYIKENGQHLQNNYACLEQEIVNSYDPNDKVCLEGNTLTPEMIGDNVHYMIRFENTGNANAVNIVVVDTIDTNKFDISSFQVTDASHDFQTKIKNGNIVQFIFENIFLPYDDNLNDGYVVFKIKTKDILNVGDNLENTAAIFFDFNWPIMTNTSQVVFESNSTGIPNEINELNFRISPNPVKDRINIEADYLISSINLYDIHGKIISNINFENKIYSTAFEPPLLTSGVYLIEVIGQKGSQATKVIIE